MELPERINGYLEDHMDGRLESEGIKAVEGWFHESPDHQRLLADWFLMQAEVSEFERVAEMRAVLGTMLPTTGTSPRPRSSGLSLRAWVGGTLLVSLAASALVFLPSWQELQEDDRTASYRLAITNPQQTGEEDVGFAATLSGLSDCVWARESATPDVGELLSAGDELKIESGLFQLSFESGANLVFHGPCEVVIDGPMQCRMAVGSVTAVVPREASGFTVRGPLSEVIDLGTSFGFEVGKEGVSQVHVFEGEVISRRISETGEAFGEEVRLTNNEAILISATQEVAQRLEADEARFIQSLPKLWSREEVRPLAISRSLALWLSAEHGVQADDEGGVVAWQDLTLGANDVANDAFQPDPGLRPTLVPDGIGGQPAIRFDGVSSHLTTTPFSTTDNQTIVAVFQYAPFDLPGKRNGGQLINYNGPPSRYLASTHNPGVLQLGERVSAKTSPVGSISAKAYIGKVSGSDVSTGWIESPPLSDGQPVVVVYVYNNRQNYSTLYVNGSRLSDASARTPIAITSRKVIGRHGFLKSWAFAGDLAELLVYNDALRPREVRKLIKERMAYYGVEASAWPSKR